MYQESSEWKGLGRRILINLKTIICRVVCNTNPTVTTLIKDHVQVRLISGSVANSSTFYSYLVPRLNPAPGPNPFDLQFSPPRGPISGGTNLSIWGNSLDTGSTRSVTIAGKLCQLSMIGYEQNNYGLGS